MRVRQTTRLVRHTIAFTALAPGALAGVLPATIVYATDAHPGPLPFALLGGAFMGLGAAGYMICAYEFITRGRGIPAPYEPPEALVIAGVYARVRNPMYVAVYAALVGESIIFLSPVLFAYACLVLLGFHLRVVLYEEPRLRVSSAPRGSIIASRSHGGCQDSSFGRVTGRSHTAETDTITRWRWPHRPDRGDPALAHTIRRL